MFLAVVLCIFVSEKYMAFYFFICIPTCISAPMILWFLLLACYNFYFLDLGEVNQVGMRRKHYIMGVLLSASSSSVKVKVVRTKQSCGKWDIYKKVLKILVVRHLGNKNIYENTLLEWI